MKVSLVGKTKKGKERVKRDGSEWNIKETRDSVAFSSNNGPWLLLENESKVLRWVNKTNDDNFSLTMV